MPIVAAARMPMAGRVAGQLDANRPRLDVGLGTELQYAPVAGEQTFSDLVLNGKIDKTYVMVSPAMNTPFSRSSSIL